MDGTRVRPAREDDADDRAFLCAMAPRLETGIPPWIPAGTLAGAVERSVLGAFEARRDGEIILLAENAHGRGLGFLYAVASRENLVDEARCHFSELAVAPDAEGHGVARSLVDPVEQWAREQGLGALMLEVFWSNAHARAVDEHLGYEPSVLHLRKRL